MQIATLSYQYDPKENVNGDSRAKLRYRHVLTTLRNAPKKSKQRQSLFSHISANSKVPLPPIETNGKRSSSIRIKGSSLTSTKSGETSAPLFHHQIRSLSRQSNRSEVSDARSRSVSSTGISRPPSKLIRLKFGYPIKLRTPDFYGPDRSEAELRIREETFVNDSVRSAHQSRRSSIIPHYDALDDPHLRRFFQSPFVLDIVRKTLNIEVNNTYKQDDRSSKSSTIKKRSKTYDSHHNDDDYLRIVTKGSSGYSKLNGYDCIPSYAAARHHRNRSRSSTVDPTASSPSSKINSRLTRSTTQDKHEASANTSITSVPTQTTNQLQQQKNTKKKSRKHDKSKQPKPIATSSPLRHPIRQLVETTPTIIVSASMIKTDGNAPEQKSEVAPVSSVSQD